jgi:AcrR family transcriptional regulator
VKNADISGSSGENLTKAAILQLAIDTLEANGETGIRVHDIAGACGVTATTLYRYFGSREGLIEAAQTEQCRRLLEFNDISIAEHLRAINSRDELHQFLSVVVDRFIADPERRRGRRMRTFLLASTVGRPELAREVNTMVRNSFPRSIDALARAKEEGWTRPDFDAAAALDFVATLFEGRVRYELLGDSIDMVGLNRFTKEAVLNVVFGPGK